MITIRSLHNGFRRAGIAHSSTPTEYPDDFFNAEQLKTLQEEKMLIVEIDAEEVEKEIPPTTAPAVTSSDDGDSPTREEQLFVAIGQLDSDKSNSQHWTRGGKPQVDKLEELTGLSKVSASERDSAFKLFEDQNK